MNRKVKSFLSLAMAALLSIQLAVPAFADDVEQEPELDKDALVHAVVLVKENEEGKAPFVDEFEAQKEPEEEPGEQEGEPEGEPEGQGEDLGTNEGPEGGEELVPEKTREELLLEATDAVEAQEGFIKIGDADLVSTIIADVSVGKVLEDGVVITPPDGYAVTDIAVEAVILEAEEENEEIQEQNPEENQGENQNGEPDLGLNGDGEENDQQEPVEVPEWFSVIEPTGEGPAVKVPAESIIEAMFEIPADAYRFLVTLMPVEVVEKVEPTCAQEGSEQVYKIGDEIFRDEACTEKLEEIPVIEKSNVHGDLIKHVGSPASCLKEGVEEYWECSVCGKLFADANASEGIETPVAIALTDDHQLHKHEAVAATCTVDGIGEFWECIVCGKIFADENGASPITSPKIVKASGHRLEEHERVEATCTEAGHEKYWRCVVCEELFANNMAKESISEPVEIPMNDNHSLKHIAAVEPTESSEGNTEYWQCEACSKIFSDKKGEHQITLQETVLAKLTPVETPAPVETVEPTQEPQPEQTPDPTPETKPVPMPIPVVPGAEPTMGPAALLEPIAKVEATCEKDGVIEHYKETIGSDITYYVRLDGTFVKIDEKDLVVPALGHNLKKVDGVEATCTAAGTEKYWKCERCGKMFSDKKGANEIEKPVVIDAKGEHRLEKHAAVKPTESENGHVAYWECTECGKLFLDKKAKKETTLIGTMIPPLGTDVYAVLKDGTDTVWTKGSEKGASIHIDAKYGSDTITSIKMGKKSVPADMYGVKEGSIIVTFKPEFLQKMDAGSYEVVIEFASSKHVNSVITIEEPKLPSIEIECEGSYLKKVYDGTSFDLNELSKHLTAKGLPDGYKVNMKMAFANEKITEMHNAGSEDFNVEITKVFDKDGNDVTDQFALEKKTFNLTIEKRKIMIETRSDSKVYDGQPWTYQHLSVVQPIVTYTDPKLGEYTRDGITYSQVISMTYTASPKEMGTYENTAKLIIRERQKDSAADPVDVTSNYDITYKFGIVKITDAEGRVPVTVAPKTGDSTNIVIWIAMFALAASASVTLMLVQRKKDNA